MKEIVLSAINVFPVKSLRGIELKEAKVERRGLQYDRRWMLVDEKNKFLTQREYPRMALVSLRLKPEGLEASAPGMNALLIPFELNTHAPVKVEIWGDTCDALFAEESVNAWFSKFLDAPCHLVYMPDESRRAVNPEYDVNQNIVSFADAYPFLLIGESSLEDLNGRLPDRLPMNRFRPNFVASGSDAFDEDDWKMVQIGTTLFHVVKPCGRCQITTIAQETGERTGQEPLKTLSRFRSANNKVLFGQYLVPDGDAGSVRLGDKIRIAERKDVETADARQ